MTVPVHTPGSTTSRPVTTPSTVDTELVQLLTPEGRRVEHERYAFDGDDESIRSMYRDLLLESMSNVNWEEIAEDLISE